ncbi:ABC transporter ATP-binding protein [Meiothermus ruber]|jgi:ABC-2 type transport system ATP-binding protein|uniref:ABC transporter n=1 Tax=Meiothermus ruber (strain ATCC 35948 / DSM 1279 / VKM B-1258 / 21) TaxID=504728 RepID=D3PRE6_MEIRD|nr:ABC transporter ATP-binding protein [Meiothermus ruber]ADD28029.1 ABC transporter related protein [Meiothermus ruber DSM 1279]AGK04499.1 ABC transporter [Meiothermus ruber DSM 1279]MCL6531345.1 ABC transporter ATP-binding protein [Meiothermus ruber]GAO74975.1 ABC transporter [Meiothermus ruber H328]
MVRSLAKVVHKASSPAVLEQVSKHYGRVKALEELSLEVTEGELLALLGPNGAGKSTAISLLAGLRRPDRGRAWLFGLDPRDPQARANLGVTPQETGLPNELRVHEVLELVQAHYPNPTPRRELLERFGLGGLERRQCGGLSGGQKRRLAVALAFAGNPRLVILDEPTTGLDVEARRSLWEGVKRYQAQGGTVLLTTHYLEEAEALASRIAVIDRGRLIAEGTVGQIKARVGLKQVRFAAAELPPLEGVSRLEREGDTFTLYTPEADTVVRQLVQKSVAFKGLEVRSVSLEEAFVALTGEPQKE